MSESYTDWNCQLLPSMGGRTTRPEQALKTMQYLYDRFSLRHYCMMPLFDTQTETVNHFLKRKKLAADSLCAQLPRGLKISSFSRALMVPGLYETPSLHRLQIPKTTYLPIFFPLIPYADWMDEEINHLLYKAKVDLLFTSFELCTVLYPEEIVQRLLRIRYAAYQWNYRALADPKLCAMIAQLLMQGKTVLLGTSLDGIEKAYRYEMDHYLSCAKRNLPSVLYQELIAQNVLFPNDTKSQ